MAVVRKDLFAEGIAVKIGQHGAAGADDEQRHDELRVREGVQIDGGDGSDHHDIKHETGNAVEHEIVGVHAVDNAFCT